MESYRVADLLRVPGLLSLSRVGLAFVFPWAVSRPLFGLAVLFLAAASDVLDGWYARRFDQVTRTGALIDPLTDKVFVLTVVVTLVARGYLSPISILLLATRELGELPLVVWLLAVHRAFEGVRANAPGKVATVLQFVTIAAATARLRHLEVAVAACAVSGAVAALLYWMRAVRGGGRPLTS